MERIKSLNGFIRRRKMVIRILLLLVALSLIPMPVFAEFYKYKDANGVLRFTDNLLEVPKDQREMIQISVKDWK